MNLQNVEFVRSAVREEDFPHDGLPQVVFAGRSNVGKSSVINRLLNRKNMARVGAQPGKTTHINFFRIDGAAYFADLPGYGYARASKAEKERWGALLELYFSRTELITAGLLVVDARHKPTADDETMCRWFTSASCPMIVVANKADKLNSGEKAACASKIREALGLDGAAPVVLFSATRGTGREELLGELLKRIK